MKKNLFFWILALVICSVISCAEKEHFEQELQTQEREQFKEDLSHEVTQAEARQNLEKIIFDLKIPSTRGGNANSMPPITSVYTRGKAAIATRAGEEIEPYFHIFNFGDEEGFAIMSGDDRVEPLLALTFKGELTPETEIDNPGFEIAYSRMEEYYVQKVSQISLNGGGILPPTIDPIPYPTYDTTVTNYVMPFGFCPVQWGQGWPYNKYCTVQPGSINVYTGCARVAVAQLMSIYKYPNSYTNPLFNYTTFYFDWDEMNQYTSNDELLNPYIADSTKYNQIARLMQQMGTSNNLNVTYNIFNLEEGSSNPDNIPITLENFGYSNGGERVSYETSIVVEELISGYPILIGGSDNSNGNPKHRWLGHGLMEMVITPIYPDSYHGVIMLPTVTNYYILCNWGWNGSCDGYYLSEAFDTSESSDYPYNPTRSGVVDNGNYQYNLDVIINIRK